MIRKIDLKKDYPYLEYWWNHYNYTLIPEAFIPENTYVYEEASKLLGCIVVYCMDKPIVWVDHLTVSPEVKGPKLKLKIIDRLLEYARFQVKSQGYVIAMGHAEMSGFRKFHNKKGFKVSEPKFSVLMGVL